MGACSAQRRQLACIASNSSCRLRVCSCTLPVFRARLSPHPCEIFWKHQGEVSPSFTGASKQASTAHTAMLDNCTAVIDGTFMQKKHNDTTPILKREAGRQPVCLHPVQSGWWPPGEWQPACLPACAPACLPAILNTKTLTRCEVAESHPQPRATRSHVRAAAQGKAAQLHPQTAAVQQYRCFAAAQVAQALQAPAATRPQS